MAIAPESAITIQRTHPMKAMISTLSLAMSLALAASPALAQEAAPAAGTTAAPTAAPTAADADAFIAAAEKDLFD
jgi:peptidyl-dipeptidase A